MATESKSIKNTQAMRQDWDERAREDAFSYIASWRRDWDEASFFASGEDDCHALVDPILETLKFDPTGKSMAELGCGAGRMTRSFAKRFGSVTGVDISEEMQSRARIHLHDCTNVRWVITDGRSLENIDAGSMDFVFSYLVLQHFPSRDLVFSTIGELIRILRPGGVFLFQFNGSEEFTMNWKGRFISAFLDNLSAVGFKRLSQSVARLVHIDPQMIGKTWRGVAVRSSDIGEFVRSAGARFTAFLGEGTPLSWCYGRKEDEGKQL
jgi:ubiquinone/menaquinone biosynthesis C-methylase UbiE